MTIIVAGVTTVTVALVALAALYVGRRVLSIKQIGDERWEVELDV